MVITESLARIVLPLSTNAFYGQLVTLNAAFFGEWRFSRHNMLFVLHSFASLAGYSESLNPYAVIPNNYFCLAGFRRPHSLASVVLSVFHKLPEQSFAFCIVAKVGFEPTTYCTSNNCSTEMSYFAKTYQDVLLQLLHTLLDTEYNTPHVFCLAGYSTMLQVSPHRFNSYIAILPSPARSDSITTR